MVTTVSECNKKISKIDSEIDRLKQERKLIVRIRDLLTEDKAGARVIGHEAYPKILEIIRNNPGLDGQGVHEALSDVKTTSRQTTQRLSHLRRQGKIENRGGRGFHSRWYIKE